MRAGGLRTINKRFFSSNAGKVGTDDILANVYGLHKIHSDTSSQIRINGIVYNDVLPVRTDTSLNRSDPVLFDSYFEDVRIGSGGRNGMIAVSGVISYIPPGYADWRVVYVYRRPYVVVRANVEGTLYTEWLRYERGRTFPLEPAFRYAGRGIGTGLVAAAEGMGIGGKHAFKGIMAGARGTARGVSAGGRGTGKGLKLAAESAATGIGAAVFNESEMFYRPSAVFEDMGELEFEERSIDVGEGIVIYTYMFRCEDPKVDIFLLHGNGGNVSTYRDKIKTLVEGRYNVFTVDWRGYGRSTGKPDYKGVMADTYGAFDDFMLRSHEDSLKVIVYGMSLGGQIAVRLAGVRQQDVDALVLDGSLSSAQNLAMDFMPTEILRTSVKKNSALFNMEYIAERDIACIVDIPKLIIHSEFDNVIQLYHGELLYNNALEPESFRKTDTRHIGTLTELPDEVIRRFDTFDGGSRRGRMSLETFNIVLHHAADDQVMERAYCVEVEPSQPLIVPDDGDSID